MPPKTHRRTSERPRKPIPRTTRSIPSKGPQKGAALIAKGDLRARW